MPLTAATHAMGCRFELVLDGLPERSLRAAADEAAREIEALHARLSPFDKSSLIAHINRSAHARPVRLDADTFALFADAQRVWRDSGGAFDITLGATMRALGIHPGAASPIAGEPPSMRDITLDHDNLTITLTGPGLRLDPGGIAKGHALDLVRDLLLEAGVPRALIHAGTSTALALGAPPDADAWRIEVALPPDISLQSEPVVRSPTIALRDAALSVSAPHGRTTANDPTITHIIDPRTARPSNNARLAFVIAPLPPPSPLGGEGWGEGDPPKADETAQRTSHEPAACAPGSSCASPHSSARLADAWSTALVVLGQRPPAMPPHFTSCILTPAGWRIEGPADPVSLPTVEPRP